MCHAVGDRCGFPFKGVEEPRASSALCLGKRPAPPDAEDTRIHAGRSPVPSGGEEGELRRRAVSGKRARRSAHGVEPHVETQQLGSVVVLPGAGTLSSAVDSAPDGAVLLLSGEYIEAQAVVLRRPITLRAAAGASPILRRRDGHGSVLVMDVQQPAAGAHAESVRASALSVSDGSASALVAHPPAAWPGLWASDTADVPSAARGSAGGADFSSDTGAAALPAAPSVVLVALRIVGGGGEAAGDAEERYGERPTQPQQSRTCNSNSHAQAAGRRQDDTEGGYALVLRASSALVLQCTVSCATGGGVFVTAAASAIFLRCEMSHTRAHAVLASGRSRIGLSHCHLHTCGSAALEVRGRAAATLHCCRVQGSRRAGLFATAFAELRAEFCDCFGCDFAGVEASAQAEVYLHRCQVHHGRRGGVLGLGSSRITLNNCVLACNSMANLTLRGSSSARATGCVLTDSRASGAYVLEAARLELDGCVVRNNRLMQVEAAWCQDLPGGRGAQPSEQLGNACSVRAGGAAAERTMKAPGAQETGVLA